MTYSLIEDPSELQDLPNRLDSEPRIAIDCEAAGFHRYSDRLCLLQLSTPGETVLLDPFRVDLGPALKPILENPGQQVIMHGADYDLRLLHRDLGIQVRGLFDTQAAASLLGASSVGLASLLEEHLDVVLSKEHQRADWAQRPLPPGLLEYAAGDTKHLLTLAEVLTSQLKDLGREEWAAQDFEALEEIRWEEDRTDPVTRVKGVRDLTPRQVMGLRAALDWRDGIARERDRAPFRIVGDPVLLAMAVDRPKNKEEMANLKGMSSRLAHGQGLALLKELDRIDGIPEADIEPLPRWNRNGFGRPTPEEEAKADGIRSHRTTVAKELGLERGVLLSNAQINAIVRAAPRSLEELAALPGIRRWQADLIGPEALRLLA